MENVLWAPPTLRRSVALRSSMDSTYIPAPLQSPLSVPVWIGQLSCVIQPVIYSKCDSASAHSAPIRHCSCCWWDVGQQTHLAGRGEEKKRRNKGKSTEAAGTLKIRTIWHGHGHYVVERSLLLPPVIDVWRLWWNSVGCCKVHVSPVCCCNFAVNINTLARSSSFKGPLYEEIKMDTHTHTY